MTVPILSTELRGGGNSTPMKNSTGSVAKNEYQEILAIHLC